MQSAAEGVDGGADTAQDFKEHINDHICIIPRVLE